MSLTRRATPTAGACLIAVTSGSAGAGKTTVAIQLALALARFDRRVALVGVDRPIDAMTGTASLSLSVLPVMRGRHHAAPSIAAATSRQADTLATAAVDRDFIVIDTPSGLADPALDPVRVADYALVVTSDEPAALVDAYATIARLTEADADRPIGVVMNNVGDMRRATIACAQLAHAARTFLGCAIAADAVIVHDPELPRRSADATAAEALRASGPAVRSVERLAARLVSWRRPDPTPDPSAPALAISRTRRSSVLAEASRCA